MPFNARNARNADAFAPARWNVPRTCTEAWTTCALDDETFAHLEFYSEVEAQGLAFIQGLGHSAADAPAIFKSFQAFLRQARSFYDSGKDLHHRASPLLLYYSFLNLAKAIIVLRDPSFVAGTVHHGISHLL